MRGRIGPARWRKAHRVIPAFWALAVVHGLTVGTDATSAWFLAALAPPVMAAAVLVGDRAGDASRRRSGGRRAGLVRHATPGHHQTDHGQDHQDTHRDLHLGG